MADTISISFAALQTASETLKQNAQTLEQTIQNLLTSIQPMYNIWVESQSSAAEACQQAQVKLTRATDDIINCISQFSGKVQEAHDMQYQLEQQNTQLFAT